MRSNTPRPSRTGRPPRGIGTLIGNGWLRESPRNANAWFGSRWDVRSRSALRKCMFLPVPEALMDLLQRAPAAGPPASPVAPDAGRRPAARELLAADVVPHRNDPRHNVRQMPAYVPGLPLDARGERARMLRDAQKAAVAGVAASPSAWWEDPVALGSLLILVPPIGLAAVWSSKRYSSDARWALTVMTALMMCLVSAVLIAALSTL